MVAGLGLEYLLVSQKNSTKKILRLKSMQHTVYMYFMYYLFSPNFCATNKDEAGINDILVHKEK